MTENNDSKYSIIHRLHSERSTIRTKAIGDLYKSHGCVLFSTPTGKETQDFEKGQHVIATGEGAVKEGVEMKIEDIMNNNGFYRYYALGQWHNQEDIKPAK